MNPDDSRAIEIIEVDLEGEAECRINGLLYTTVRVGDIVYGCDMEGELIADFPAIPINRIRVFGRDLPEVDRGYYVELFVDMGYQEALQGVKYLRFE